MTDLVPPAVDEHPKSKSFQTSVKRKNSDPYMLLSHLDRQLRGVGVLRRQQLRHELVQRRGPRDHLEVESGLISY